MMRTGKLRLYRTIETLWAGGFSLAGQLAAQQVEVWTSLGGQRVVVIATHPDDEAAGCAGTILRHKQNQDSVWVIFVTDGSGSSARRLPQSEMKRRRQRESIDCARILQVDHPVWLDLLEYGWRADQLYGALAALIADIRPDLIYAPSLVDYHPEHKRVAGALGQLINAHPEDFSGTTFRVYPVHVPLTPALANLVTPVNGVMEQVTSALRCYATQSGSLPQVLRLRRYAGELHGLGQPVEEFWQLTPRAYGYVHSPFVAADLDYSFEGLRPGPLADPLCYLHGLGQRRKINTIARLGEAIATS